MFNFKKLIYGLPIVVAFFIAVFYVLSPKEIQIPYNKFEALMASGDIVHVEVMPNGNTLHITTAQKGVVYVVNVPRNSNTLDVLMGGGVTVDLAEAPSQPGLFFMLLVGIIPVFILVGATIYINRKPGNGVLEFGKLKHKLTNPDNNKTRMCDVICNPGEHDEAREIIDFLTNAKKYSDAKAKFPKGILLAGPPGVGKTLICKAIAGEAGVPFYYAAGSEFDEMLVGVGAGRIRSLFQQAKTHPACIVFIDEIDAVGRERGNGAMGNGNQTLNQLLVEMDGFDTNNVIVIAATNKVDVLDPALVRPGRFDRIVKISMPEVDARAKIFTLFLNKMNCVSDINPHELAKTTTGFSGAEIEKMVNEAAIYAARNDRTYITESDLSLARDKVMMGEKTPKKMSKDELRKTAFHEAGHAIIAWLLKEHHDPLIKVSIIPRTSSLGVTVFAPAEDKYTVTTVQLSAMVKTLFAGRAAEELIYGTQNVSTGASNDIERATNIARNMVERWGMSSVGCVHVTRDMHGKTLLSQDISSQVDKEVIRILDTSYDYAITALQKNIDKLKIVAELLLEKETLHLSDIETVMQGSNSADH